MLKRLHTLPAFVFTATVLLMQWSCSSEECLGNHSALPKAGFYSSLSPLESFTPPKINIGGVGAPADSMLLIDSYGASQCYLPFRIDSDITQYQISCTPDEGTTLTDIVTFEYDRVPYFVNSACGAMYNFKIRSITTTGNVIDSVVCPEQIITNANIENLRIYFHLLPSDM